MEKKDNNKKNNEIVITQTTLIIVGLLFSVIILMMLFQMFEIHGIQKQNSEKNLKIEALSQQLESEKQQNELLEKEVKQKEELPSCDSPEITNMVIENLKKTRLFYNNKYNTFQSAKVIAPTTVKYDKDIPRYECRAKIKYNYYCDFDYIKGNQTDVSDVFYSISKSLGKPVVYTTFQY